MTYTSTTDVEILEQLARRALVARGLEPDFAKAAQAQARAYRGPAPAESDIRDLRHLPWASIDNDDSLDLDQLTYAEPSVNGGGRVMVAVADVDALVALGSPIDGHARTNTTTIYTAGGIFPMLPLRLSNDLTSLNPGEDRRAVVVSYEVDGEGAVAGSEVFLGLVHNQAKLTYRAVGAWLADGGDMPSAMAAATGVPEQMRLQDGIARLLRQRRHEQGALELETLEPTAIREDGRIADLGLEPKNRAHELIEDFMIAANTVTTRFLVERGLADLRRVVRIPQRWDRIQALAREVGETLPDRPDSRALNDFLGRRRQVDPLRFPDLSLAIVKLLGSGEYVVHRPGETPIGHFGLAVRDYAHSTAPNRRFPDVITQRLLKAALRNVDSPYSPSALQRLAAHCTEREDEVKKAERQVLKSAGALLLRERVGDRFDALVTGAGPKGTWVRILRPPVEGKVVRGEGGLDVGDQVRVRLLSVDVERGFIDFAVLA